MRLAVLVFLCTWPCFSQDAECTSAIQVIEANGQLTARNTSDEPITAYRITRLRSRDRKEMGTYGGSFSDRDDLAPGQSLVIGRASPAAAEYSVDYVRLANGWQCGEAPVEGSPNQDSPSSSR